MLDKLRRHEIDTLHAPIPKCNDNQNSLEQLIMAWFDIFNRTFFAGGLTLIRDRVFAKRGLAMRNGRDPRDLFGRFVHKSGERGMLEINLSVTPDSTYGGSMEQVHIGTLLHEMLHAFFDYYSCTCQVCLNKRSVYQGGSGKSGHGPAWANSMIAMAKAVQDQVSWDVDIGMMDSIEREMLESNWEPTKEELRRWGLGTSHLNSQVSNKAEEARREFEEGARRRRQLVQDREEDAHRRNIRLEEEDAIRRKDALQALENSIRLKRGLSSVQRPTSGLASQAQLDREEEELARAYQRSISDGPEDLGEIRRRQTAQEAANRRLALQLNATNGYDLEMAIQELIQEESSRF
jgi:hypothetical protein